jgi:hypothetical protein
MRFLAFYLMPILCQLVMAVSAIVVYRKLKKSGALIIAIGLVLAPLSSISISILNQLIHNAGMYGPDSIEFLALQGMVYFKVISLVVAAIGFVVFAKQIARDDRDAT